MDFSLEQARDAQKQKVKNVLSIASFYRREEARERKGGRESGREGGREGWMGGGGGVCV
jgi:hypothetical protein